MAIFFAVKNIISGEMKLVHGFMKKLGKKYAE